MEEISCILCGKSSNHIAVVENGYTGRKCDNCNLIYISPRPTQSDVKNLYTHEHAVLYADAEFQFEKIVRKGAALTLAKMHKYRKEGDLLEIGPGAGFFLLEAQKNGYKPYALELNPIEARWISEKLNIPCENTPLNPKSFGGRQFDIVYHRDVLSHLHDPIETFKGIHRAMKDGGLLVFETGNIGEIQEKYYKYFYQFGYPDHLFFFGAKSIEMLLERTGFRCLGIFREAIFLQMLVQKALWGFKDLLKDKQVLEKMKSQPENCDMQQKPTVKRRLRNLYRYFSYYLVRLGAILPKEGRPLKLIVIAERSPDGTSVV